MDRPQFVSAMGKPEGIAILNSLTLVDSGENRTLF
jgi:hypothetical protein